MRIFSDYTITAKCVGDVVGGLNHCVFPRLARVSREWQCADDVRILR